MIRAKWSRKTHPDTQCHQGEVLSVAVSTDIYDTRLHDGNAEVQAFTGHRDAVTSLAFQKDSYSLFSGSNDR